MNEKILTNIAKYFHGKNISKSFFSLLLKGSLGAFFKGVQRENNVDYFFCVIINVCVIFLFLSFFFKNLFLHLFLEKKSSIIIVVAKSAQSGAASLKRYNN